ncbi:MAG: sel1 repeat family protein [Myxococcota bacterium]|nr:sel1 repeat family protein [Myxococcota bacterium]
MSCWWGAGALVLACESALGCGSAAPARDEAVMGRAVSSGGEEVPHCSVIHAAGAEEFEDGERAARDGDIEGAQRLFARSCDIGNPCACTELGESYVDPPAATVARDAERGATLLERGCEGGDSWGCYMLATAIWRFFPERIEHARDLYDDACDDGLPDACSALGRFRASGVDGDRSERDAMRLYDRACRGGSQHACVMLGEAYAEGLGTSRDPGRAAELLTWACDEANVAHACAAWADLLDVDDEQRGELLRRACDGGYRVACDELDPAAARMGGEPALRALASSPPEARAVRNGSQELPASIGGTVDLATLGLRPACVGFVGSDPTAVLTVPPDATELRVRVHAAADTVLAIRDPEGRWSCADDGSGGNYDPTVELGDPVAGDYLVWAGTIERTSLPGQLVIDAIAPIAAPPVTYESLPEPTAETVPIPTRRVRFFQLEITAMPGLRGRVRLDGQELWSWDAEGGSITLADPLQCALGTGTHTFDIDVVQRADDARVISGEGGLVHLALRGSDRAGLQGDDTQLFEIDWSPEEPSRRRLEFSLSRRQAAQQIAACRE